MGQRTIKRKRKPVNRYAAPIDETDGLTAWVFPDAGPETGGTLFTIYKHAFMENARILAEKTKLASPIGQQNGYTVVAAFPDSEARDRAFENIRTARPEMNAFEHPVPQSLGRLRPVGAVFPGGVDRELARRMADDADMREFWVEGIATRMQEHGEDRCFVVPDLSPEQYEEVMERRRRKPQ
jgi:hypothetical protein